MGKTYDYSPAHRALEIFAIIAFLALAGALGWRVYGGIDGHFEWLLVAGMAFGGYLAADLVSGIVHWLADTYGTSDTPLAGPNLVRPFREHHRWPEDLTYHDFIETNGNNCLVSVPAMVAFLFVPVTGPIGLAAVAFMLFLTISVFGTNQFHKWAHLERPSLVVRMLQKSRLILGRAHHKKHHTAPFDTYYCITTGWLNWPLATFGFWRFLEWTILKVTGIRARNYFDGPAQVGAKPKGVKIDADGSLIPDGTVPETEIEVELGKAASEAVEQQPSAA